MDTMTMTKVVGALCGSLLIFLLGGWAADLLYHTGGSGHGDDHHQAYVIDTGDDGGHGGEEVAEVPFEEVFAAADPGRGERSWRKCQACHKLEAGANATGPYLFGVVGRPKGAANGFNYSGALAATETPDWTPESLNAFLESPKSYAPGTSMNFAGLSDVEERANLIAYLQTFQ